MKSPGILLSMPRLLCGEAGQIYTLLKATEKLHCRVDWMPEHPKSINNIMSLDILLIQSSRQHLLVVINQANNVAPSESPCKMSQCPFTMYDS